MSKKIRNLIICGGVVLLLVASLCLLLFLPKATTETVSSTPSTDTSLITLIEEETQTLTSLEIKNTKDSYTIELLGENKWGIKALDGFSQLETYSEAIGAASIVYSSAVIEENATDLDQYGLKNPSIVYTAKYSNGNNYSVEIGDTRSNLYLTYMKMGDSNTVYSVSSTKFSALAKTPMDYLTTEIIPAPAVDEKTGQAAVPDIQSVEITREGLEEPITLKKFDKSEFSPNTVTMTNLQMRTPVISELNSNNVERHIMSNFGLTAESAVAVKPTAAQLTEFGLDAPTATFSMTYDETNKVKLIAGKALSASDEKSGGKDVYYFMREGRELVYLVAKENIKWTEITPEMMISSVPILAPVLDLDTVEVTIDGKTNIIGYTPGEGEGNEVSEMTSTLNGDKLDISLGKKYLQLLYVTDVSGINKSEPVGKPVVTVRYKYREGGRIDTLEIYELADRTTIIAVNGNASFTGRAGYIEKLRTETVHLLAGEPIDTER